MGISTHVLDTAKGCPAAGVGITLENDRGVIARGVTDGDGRLKLIDDPPAAGTYRITFDTGGYDPNGFFPRVVIEFRVAGEAKHYHVPLLLSPFGYSTYRGS
ncbi:MAG TPA: hydroxyisourate hydrolase [Thermoanaerobaculia bacterium]|jgi:5-hydroxyisourate hydrolase|nr:hydroxyisourate hydrolase [Thermoanaerobaculia bacterium]